MDQQDNRTKNPKVSVLVAAFNVDSILPRSLNSALSQTLRSGCLEVIVVDDASQDATLKIAKAFATQDSRVRVLRSRANVGPGAARAIGLAAAAGDWIAVLDADDAMATGRLCRLINTAEERNLDFIADNLTLLDPEAGPMGVAFPLNPEQSLPLSPERLLLNAVPGGKINLGWMKPGRAPRVSQ